MKRTFALGDLHGNYNLWKAILSKLDPTDKVYCLGDVVDRGPKGYEILIEMLADDRFTLLKGNHEDMFAESIKTYSKHGEGYDWLHISNGGEPTLTAWINAGAKPGLLGIINRLPKMVKYINKNFEEVCLSHAGFNPETDEEYRDYLWDREHFYEFTNWNRYSNYYIIHGHTPIVYMLEDPEKKDVKITSPYWYDEGHKCCIDFLSWRSNYTFLLDLDTFEAVEVRV